jgi:anti-sigma factor RsiW
MLTLNCEQVRAELSAYHDEELPVADRIAISDHLAACPACTVEADDLLAIRDALRAIGHSDVESIAGLNRLQSDILERCDAEEKASLTTRIEKLFEDPRRASASLVLSFVASLCVAMGAFVLAQGPVRHPESLEAVMNQASRMGNIFLPPSSVELPRVHVEAVMPAAVMNRYGSEESVAFAALVTADGELADLAFLGEQSRRGHRSPPVTHEQLSQLLNAAATARFEPARVAGLPVSLNVVWLVTHRTVRARLQAHVRVRVDGWKTL